jgi:hypothetical protein
MITQALTPLEALIDAAVTYPAFADAARAAFSGKSGEDVLAALTAVAHPLFPPEGRTPEAVAREIGRREVVALLLRASGNISPTPAHARPTHYGVHNADLDALATTGSADQPIQPAAPAAETSATSTPARSDRPAFAYPDGADPYADANPPANDAGGD